MMQSFFQDIRYAGRVLVKSPGFTIVAVLTLAVGIGANAAIFSQVDAVFFKMLPVENPEQLRTFAWTSPRPGFIGGTNVRAGPRLAIGETYGTFSYPAYSMIRDGAASFSDLACWLDIGEQRPIVMEELGFGSVQFVSGNYFRMLGVRALLGRTLAPEDDLLGSVSTVAVVSHRFWQRVFGGDPEVLQQTINLNGTAFAIVGVMPEAFFGLDPSITPDVMIPMTTVQIAAATANPLENNLVWERLSGGRALTARGLGRGGTVRRRELASPGDPDLSGAAGI